MAGSRDYRLAAGDQHKVLVSITSTGANSSTEPQPPAMISDVLVQATAGRQW